MKHRLISQREMDKVDIKLNGRVFTIAVKIARDLRGVLLNIFAEFEDCKKAASLLGVPVKDIIRKAEGEARKRFS